LSSIVKETLRLYPSAPVFARKLAAETTIGEYTFPANVTLAIPPYMMARDPKLFPDPLKFDPLRFNGENKIVPFSFIPFSAGPRYILFHT
jgi:cytochrome P450 family 4